MFSCCCARVDITWVFRTVCDCYAKHSRCDNTCLSKSLVEDSLFYNIGLVRRPITPLSPSYISPHPIGPHRKHHNPLPRLQHLASRTFAWRGVGFPPGHDLRTPSRNFRVTRRAPRLDPPRYSSPTRNFRNRQLLPCSSDSRVPHCGSDPPRRMHGTHIPMCTGRIRTGNQVPPGFDHRVRYRREAQVECRYPDPSDQGGNQ